MRSLFNTTLSTRNLTKFLGFRVLLKTAFYLLACNVNTLKITNEILFQWNLYTDFQ